MRKRENKMVPNLAKPPMIVGPIINLAPLSLAGMSSRLEHVSNSKVALYFVQHPEEALYFLTCAQGESNGQMRYVRQAVSAPQYDGKDSNPPSAAGQIQQVSGFLLQPYSAILSGSSGCCPQV
jgi:hypothetical protein